MFVVLRVSVSFLRPRVNNSLGLFSTWGVQRYFEESSVAVEYAKCRPVAPEEVFSRAIKFLTGETEQVGDENKLALAVDVGCGTGHQSTVPLTKYFKHIIGTDISSSQIEVARASNHPENIQFVVAPAEEIPIADQSVSMVICGAAAHWFDLENFYKECDRILIPGGVVALYSHDAYSMVDDHPNSEAINSIMREIIDRQKARGFYKLGNYINTGKYKDPRIQIPYEDKTRVDDIIQKTSASLATFISFNSNHSAFRRMQDAEPDLTSSWYDDLVQRLMAAIGTRDMNCSLTYTNEMFLLLGRKPAAQS